MPRPSPEPWAQDARAAAARLATVPAFVPSPPPAPVPPRVPRAPVPDAPPRGLRRAARRVGVCALVLLVMWHVLTGAVFP